jgi:hypothetical protein
MKTIAITIALIFSLVAPAVAKVKGRPVVDAFHQCHRTEC